MKKRGTRLYCFSPPVMVATFIIEIALAVYSFFKSRKANSDLVITWVLFFLATFQLAEYQVCGGINALFWSRVGLFSITLLPILGLYLISKLSREKMLLKIGILIAVVFCAYFIFAPMTAEQAVCTGNYIIFDINSGVHALYGYYYFGFLLIGILEAVRAIKSEKNKDRLKKALKWFIIGYLSFILPLTAVYIFIPITRVAIASIMCGFAVIFAIILTFKVAPIYYEIVKRDE